MTDFDCTRRTTTAFAVTSPLQRVITTSILLIMVATIIPYQFAYLVLCLVQLATSVRALRLAQETVSFSTILFALTPMGS
jgi:glycosylphosphatidylinositol deacylase